MQKNVRLILNANRIKLRRIELCLTQMELARLAGVSHPTIVMLEKQQGCPYVQTLVSIANVLRMHPFDMFDEEIYYT